MVEKVVGRRLRSECIKTGRIPKTTTLIQGTLDEVE